MARLAARRTGGASAVVVSASLSRRTALAAGLAAAGAAALAGLGLSGCSGGDEEVSSEPANPSAGKLGGKLVLYTSCSESLVNAVVPAFMHEHGVAVSVVRASTGECLARVADEVAAGAPVADVVWGGDASWYVGAEAAGTDADGAAATPAAAGCFETYVSAENGSAREGCRCVGGIATPVTREVGVVAVMPDVAEAGEVVGYGSLLAGGAGGGPLGVVALEDVATSAAGLLHAVALAPSEGDDAAEANVAWERAGELLATSEVVSADEVGDGESALAAVVEGRAVAGLAQEQSCLMAARAGRGVRAVYPEEGVAVTCGCTAIVRGCDNLEQAQAWVDFVTGATCQQVLVAEAAARPVRADVDDPDGVPEVPDAMASVVGRAALLATWESVAEGSWVPAEEPDDEGVEGEVVETPPQA